MPHRDGGLGLTTQGHEVGRLEAEGTLHSGPAVWIAGVHWDLEFGPRGHFDIPGLDKDGGGSAVPPGLGYR